MKPTDNHDVEDKTIISVVGSLAIAGQISLLSNAIKLHKNKMYKCLVWFLCRHGRLRDALSLTVRFLNARLLLLLLFLGGHKALSDLVDCRR